jgi:hypothetical protein
MPRISTEDSTMTCQSEAKAERPRVHWMLALFAFLLVGMTTIGLRHKIVRAWPQANGIFAAIGLPVNLYGLDIKNIRTVLSEEGTERVLLIEGDILNIGKRDTTIPRLSLILRGAKGETIYTWQAPAPQPVLGTGDVTTFHARLAAPPEAARDVLVRFAKPAERG